MNRLWVRISIVISTVVVAALLLPLISGFLASRPLVIAGIRPPLHFPVYPELNADVQYRLLAQFIFFLARVAIIGGILGIGAGIWTSRYLTAPLEELAEGAQEIGAKHLSYRVPLKGTQEIVAVARSFNEMAAALESAETMRQNLLADVAHELRTPLTVLQGSLRAILDDVYAMDKAEVARLYDQTRHLSRLVNDLHELAQAEAHQLPLSLAPLDMAELVEATSATFEPLAEAHGVGLKVELPREPAWVHADAARLTQVLQNLLGNALRHTPAGGTITLRVEIAGGEVVITVQDTGDGIAPEHLGQVFDRFYRTDRARDRDKGGAGLGLAIVRAMVKAHGGHVEAASPGLGQGSTFTVYLPS